jgi:hypothetical protein
MTAREQNAGSRTRPLYSDAGYGGAAMNSVSARSGEEERNARLDSIVSDATDRIMESRERSSDLEGAHDEVDKLEYRYGPGGASKLVDEYLQVAKIDDPELLRQVLAQKYATKWNAPDALKRQGEAEALAKPAMPGKEAHPFKRLDHIIEQSINAAETKGDKQAKMAAVHAKLVAAGLDPARTLRSLTALDSDLFFDPIGTSARISAHGPNGAPVTELGAEARQQQAAQAQADQTAIATIEAMAQNSPELLDHTVQQYMADVLADPNFPRSGDMRTDISLAFEATKSIMARERLQQQQAVEKAKRAAPIATTNGMRVKSSSNDDAKLDELLSGVLERHSAFFGNSE